MLWSARCTHCPPHTQAGSGKAAEDWGAGSLPLPDSHPSTRAVTPSSLCEGRSCAGLLNPEAEQPHKRGPQHSTLTPPPDCWAPRNEGGVIPLCTCPARSSLEAAGCGCYGDDCSGIARRAPSPPEGLHRAQPESSQISPSGHQAQLRVWPQLSGQRLLPRPPTAGRCQHAIHRLATRLGRKYWTEGVPWWSSG